MASTTQHHHRRETSARHDDQARQESWHKDLLDSKVRTKPCVSLRERRRVQAVQQPRPAVREEPKRQELQAGVEITVGDSIDNAHRHDDHADDEIDDEERQIGAGSRSRRRGVQFQIKGRRARAQRCRFPRRFILDIVTAPRAVVVVSTKRFVASGRECVCRKLISGNCPNSRENDLEIGHRLVAWRGSVMMPYILTQDRRA